MKLDSMPTETEWEMYDEESQSAGSTKRQVRSFAPKQPQLRKRSAQGHWAHLQPTKKLKYLLLERMCSWELQYLRQ